MNKVPIPRWPTHKSAFSPASFTLCATSALPLFYSHSFTQASPFHPQVCDICGVFINSTDNEQRRRVSSFLQFLCSYLAQWWGLGYYEISACLSLVSKVGGTDLGILEAGSSWGRSGRGMGQEVRFCLPSGAAQRTCVPGPTLHRIIYLHNSSWWVPSS